MATLNECIEALASTIRTYSTARVYDYVPDTPTTDCVILRPPASATLTFGRGVVEYMVEALVIAGSMNEKNAQRWLNDQITGEGSDTIVGAIFEHPTLGTSTTESVADSATTMNASTLGYRDYALVSFDGTNRHWSAVVEIMIRTKRSA